MNVKLLEYALNSLYRNRGKHLFIFTIFSVIIFVCLSLFLVSAGVKKEAQFTLDNLPDILVQQKTAGFQQFIKGDIADDIVVIPGVKNVAGRLWGSYPFDYLNTNLTIYGIDIFDPNQTETIKELTSTLDTTILRNEKSMIIGENLNEIINQIYNKDEFSFQKPNGDYITLKIAGIMTPASQMITTGTILTDQESAAQILGIPSGHFTDIAVNVTNSQEISTIEEKIKNMSPAFRVLTKEVITASYQNMFDFKGGIFLLSFITTAMTFFMIVFDRMSGISGEESREIAILKSIGWSTKDVLIIKLYESAVVSVFAYLVGFIASLIYVFILKAPWISTIFVGYSYLKPAFEIPFSASPTLFIIVFFVTVPVYASAVIIPSWKTASKDPGEVIR